MKCNKKFNNEYDKNDIKNIIKNDFGYSYRRGSSLSYRSNTPRLQHLRSLYSIKLFEDLNAGKYIMSIDECSFNRSLCNNYSWLPKNVPAAILSSNCLGRCSLILGFGTDGHFLGIICCETVNDKVYIEYLKLLAYCMGCLKIKIDKNLVLTLDNAAIHRSHDTVDVLHKIKFYIHYLPPYTPQLQCVELVFRHIKNFIRKKYASKILDFDKTSGMLAIIKSLNGANPEDLNKNWKTVIQNCVRYAFDT